MRILYTIRIAPVISEADVSYNGLFIGLWTTVEISLVFVVACALCLPRLIQTRGSRFRMPLSCPPSPSLSLQGTIRSRKGSLSSESRESVERELAYKLDWMESGTPLKESDIWGKQRYSTETCIQSRTQERSSSYRTSHDQDGFQRESFYITYSWRSNPGTSLSVSN